MTETHEPRPSRHVSDLAQLERVFGDDAEMVSRGLAVASSTRSLSDALTEVLRVMEARHREDAPASDLQRRIARAMWPGEADEPEELDEGPLARLTTAINTSAGVFPAGTAVRVVDRFRDGRLLVQALDVYQSTFPVAEAAVEPWQQQQQTPDGQS